MTLFSCDMFQVDQGVLLFLASDCLGRPIAALLLSDVPPPSEEEDLEKDEKEEGSNVENGNDVERDIVGGEKADIGMKERLELATGLEVVIFVFVSFATGLEVVFFGIFSQDLPQFFCGIFKIICQDLAQVSPFTTLHLGLYLCLVGRCRPKQNTIKTILFQFPNSDLRQGDADV